MRRTLLLDGKWQPKNGNRISTRKKTQSPGRLIGFLRMSLFYCVLVACQTFFFVYFNEIKYQLVVYSLFPGILLGVSVYLFEWAVTLLKTVTTYIMGRLLAGFVLFFVYLIGYIYLFSFVVASPLGRIIQETFGSEALSRDYGLYSVNSIIILAVLSWFKWLRGIYWTPPRHTSSSGSE